jgi:hypothetical protein
VRQGFHLDVNDGVARLTFLVWDFRSFFIGSTLDLSSCCGEDHYPQNIFPAAMSSTLPICTLDSPVMSIRLPGYFSLTSGAGTLVDGD